MRNRERCIRGRDSRWLCLPINPIHKTRGRSLFLKSDIASRLDRVNVWNALYINNNLSVGYLKE